MLLRINPTAFPLRSPPFVGAKRLVLNHFSPRYKGDEDPGSVRTCRRIEKLARVKGEMKEEDVIAAWDFLDIDVPPSTENKT